MTMVERMARAMIRSDYEENGHNGKKIDAIVERDWRLYEPTAIAVLEEMLKPTPGMVEAGESAWSSATGYQYSGVSEAYAAMITAALQEGKGE